MTRSRVLLHLVCGVPLVLSQARRPAAAGGPPAEVLTPRVMLSGLAMTESAGVPEPFWRKEGDAPTVAPDWYRPDATVTRELHYDASRTPQQNGDRLEAAFESLQAGDHLVVHAGEYVLTSRLYVQAPGTAAEPILVRAADGADVTIRQADGSRNAMEIDNSSYLTLAGFEITGGDQGVRIYNGHHIMLYGNELHGFDGTAVTANSQPTSHLYFVDNEIHDTASHGEAFYLGSHDGTRPTHHTWVVGNYIHDLNNADVSQGDGIEIKQNSYAVTVKWNFVRNTNYPGIIAYGTGRGAEERNVIEENVVLASDDAAIQVGSEAVVRNNLVVTSGTAFLSKVESYSPRHLDVVHNTFVTPARAVRTFGWGEAAGESITFANNAIHSGSGQFIPNGTGNATTAGNVLVSDLSAAFVNLKADGSALDATPREGGPLMGAASRDYLSATDLFGAGQTFMRVAGAVDFPIPDLPDCPPPPGPGTLPGSPEPPPVLDPPVEEPPKPGRGKGRKSRELRQADDAADDGRDVLPLSTADSPLRLFSRPTR